ncbi:MAG TPA: hypothetical protein VMD75_16005 [Candidatus Binataceae bacterium]|nr:hypothetical protein [Candidatus Binataceae bacterium]
MVAPVMSSSPPRIRCREIDTADIDGIATLLTIGFSHHHRTREFWMRALKRLSEHSTPPGFPKYGYLLDCNGALVGVILLIFAAIQINGETRIRCNTSAWYVEPAYRSYAAMLVSRALRHKGATYLNTTPDPHTLPTLDAQGYVRYCGGRFVSIPALGGWSSGARVSAIAPDTQPGEDLSSSEVDLLLAHASYGCVSLICSSANRRYPFVFMTGRKYGLVPYVHLVYCRALEEFVRFAGPLGRFLMRHGFPLVILDANGPIRGLIGTYSAAPPKYFRGPDQPRLGDLAYTEQPMFGLLT